MATKPNHAVIYRHVPAYLARIREAAGLTQRDLARKVRRSQWWVARIETGSRRIDVAEFILFCAGCNADPAAIIRELQKHR
jgi:transcriptional regulator with XRE-family HTH domain